MSINRLGSVFGPIESQDSLGIKKNFALKTGEILNSTNTIQNKTKYEKLIDILLKSGIKSHEVAVFERPENFCKVVYILGQKPATIILSLEENKNTMFYDGYIPVEDFFFSQQGQEIDGIKPKIILSENFEDEFLKIFNTNTEEEKIKENPRIIEYREQIESILPELKELRLQEVNGKFYFFELKGSNLWPKMKSGRNLTTFPTSAFNKENGIGNKHGVITSKESLKKLFDKLGFNVATEEEERTLLRKKFEKFLPYFKKAGVRKHNGAFYFGKCSLDDLWLIIPNDEFFRVLSRSNLFKGFSLYEKKEVFSRHKYLILLFKYLGFEVIDENLEREKAFFKSQIEARMVNFKYFGLREENGVYYFNNFKGKHYEWQKYFLLPTKSFNKKHNLGNNLGITQGKKQMAKFFEFLGFNVSFDGLK